MHLAQLRPIIREDKYNRVIAWRYFHDNKEKHLQLERAPFDSRYIIKQDWKELFVYIFNIGILQLTKDIKFSIERPSGYLEMLRSDMKLQQSFSKTISQIYEV